MKNEDINKKPFTLEQLEEAIKEHGLSTGSDIARGVGLALNIAKSMLQKTVPLFEKGDTVHVISFSKDIPFGVSREGVVEEIQSDFSASVRVSPTHVEVHPEKHISFAKFSVRDGGFSQERPKRKPKIGEWGWFDNGVEDKYVYAPLGEIVNDKGFVPKGSNVIYMAFHLQNPVQ